MPFPGLGGSPRPGPSETKVQGHVQGWSHPALADYEGKEKPGQAKVRVPPVEGSLGGGGAKLESSLGGGTWACGSSWEPLQREEKKNWQPGRTHPTLELGSVLHGVPKGGP